MKLTEVLQHATLRLDEKFVARLRYLDFPLADSQPLRTFARASWMERSRPVAPYRYYELSSVEAAGLATPYEIGEDEPEPGSEEARIISKVGRGDCGQPQSANGLLLPRVRTSNGKFLIPRDPDAHFTREFLEVSSDALPGEYLYFLFTHPLVIEQIDHIAWVGKRYPTIYPLDLERYLLFPRPWTKPDPAMIAGLVSQYQKIEVARAGLTPRRLLLDTCISSYTGEIASVGTTSAYAISLTEALASSSSLRISSHFLDPLAMSVRNVVPGEQPIPLREMISAPISLGVSPEYATEDTGFYYLSPAAMASGRIDTEKLRPVMEESWQKNVELSSIQCGDVLLRRSGASLGKVLFVPDNDHFCIYSDFMMRIRFREVLAAEAVSYLLESSYGQTWLASVKVVGKGGYQNIYPSQLGSFPVPRAIAADFEEFVAGARRALSTNQSLHLQAQAALADGLAVLSEALNP